MREPIICCVPNCGRMQHSSSGARGLCGPCYQQAHRLILLHETSWHELEALGLAVEQQRERKPTKPTPFMVAYLAKKLAQVEENHHAG